jgi:hypothetical protein
MTRFVRPLITDTVLGRSLVTQILSVSGLAATNSGTPPTGIVATTFLVPR